MSRKTKKAHSKRKQATALQTIPELRQSFDYIDEFAKNRIVSGVPKEQLVKEIQREWLRVFSKRIQKKNATAFVEHLMELTARRRGLRGTRKRTRIQGGVAPSMDPTTQPGMYLASGLPPTSSGHYPLTNGTPSVYGSLTSYISKGFQVPEIAAMSDPVKGQSVFPTPSPSMGSNLVRGGSRALRYKKKQGGFLLGSIFSQATTRPVQSDVPRSILQDAQSSWYGRGIGPSPDQVQRVPHYQLSAPTGVPMNVKIDV